MNFSQIYAKIYTCSQNAMHSILGSIRHNGIQSYWWSQVINFGDWMTPALLEHYGFIPVLSSPATAKVVMTGSILEHLPEDYAGIILGAGLLRSNSARSFPKATILAVRGELTRQRTHAPQDVVLGDPGLLVSQIFKGAAEKCYPVGIIPHYVDRKDPRIASIHRRYQRETHIIDVQRDPRKVFHDISQCEVILSSSLHGVIVADALGIPNAWLYLSDKVIGGSFKFDDYNSSLHVKRVPLCLSGDEKLTDLIKQVETPPSTIPMVKNDLHHLFLAFQAEMLRKRKKLRKENTQ
jgi:pyruvyltransferase